MHDMREEGRQSMQIFNQRKNMQLNTQNTNRRHLYNNNDPSQIHIENPASNLPRKSSHHAAAGPNLKSFDHQQFEKMFFGDAKIPTPQM